MKKETKKAICKKCRNFDNCEYIKFTKRAKHLTADFLMAHRCKDFIDSGDTML